MLFRSPQKTSLEQLLRLCLAGVTPEISPVGSKSSPSPGVTEWHLLVVQNYSSTMNVPNCLEIGHGGLLECFLGAQGK